MQKTAKGKVVDLYQGFSQKAGVYEDLVTGSAHLFGSSILEE